MMLERLFGKPDRFDVLKEEVGFGLAVVIMLNELPDKFFSYLKDEQWYELISICENHEQRLKVAEKLSIQMKPLNQWAYLYRKCPSEHAYSSFISGVAIKKWIEQAKIFNDFSPILAFCDKLDDQTIMKVLKEMSRLAKTLSEWREIYEITKHTKYHEERDYAFEMMKKYR